MRNGRRTWCVGGRESMLVRVRRHAPCHPRQRLQAVAIGIRQERHRAGQHRADVLTLPTRNRPRHRPRIGHGRQSFAAEHEDLRAVATEHRGGRVPAGGNESFHDAPSGGANVDDRHRVVVGIGDEQALLVR